MALISRRYSTIGYDLALSRTLRNKDVYETNEVTNSVAEGSGLFFFHRLRLPVPAPAHIKSRISTITFFSNNIPPSLLEKKSLSIVFAF